MSSGTQERMEQAQAELIEHVGQVNSPDVAGNLMNGLTLLRQLLLTRLHTEVEAEFGIDSVLAPASAAEELREMLLATDEIEAYSLDLVVDEAACSGFSKCDSAWFRDWLLRLRCADDLRPTIRQRLESYNQLNVGQRRRVFSSALERALPEARKAPLIIYRLYPRAVRIATALAFGDAMRARELRSEQISFLPIIADCHHCHGAPLENGEICIECGNPLWKIKWLSVTD